MMSYAPKTPSGMSTRQLMKTIKQKSQEKIRDIEIDFEDVYQDPLKQQTEYEKSFIK